MNWGSYKEAEESMKKGDAKAKTRVAFLKLSGRGGAEIDRDGAVVLLEERVKDRDDEAAWMLGLCCEYGLGTEQDIERAKMLYSQSRDAGNAIGEFLFYNKEDFGCRTHKSEWCLWYSSCFPLSNQSFLTIFFFFCCTVMNEAMKERIGDVVSVAPWTSLDLTSRARSRQKRMK